MQNRPEVARDISYSYAASSPGGRAMVRLMENATGRLGLIRRAQGYEHEVAQGRDFWQVMVERYGLALEILRGQLADIPQDGPLIVIANHPYGILDGLMLGHMLSITRGDFRILANSVFQKAEDLNRVILPVDFEQSKAALQRNLDTRRAALDYLGQGGCIGIFPGGTVATAARPFSKPMDPGWRTFTARLIAKSGAQVVPIHFDGQTSRMFQLASHVHTNLRLGLLIKEFNTRVDTPVRVSIGQPIAPEQIAARAKDARALMDFLRKATYELSPTPLPSYAYGYEFDDTYKSGCEPPKRIY